MTASLISRLSCAPKLGVAEGQADNAIRGQATRKRYTAIHGKRRLRDPRNGRRGVTGWNGERKYRDLGMVESQETGYKSGDPGELAHARVRDWQSNAA